MKASIERREQLPEESLLYFSVAYFRLTRASTADIAEEVLRKLGTQKNRYVKVHVCMHVLYTGVCI